MSQRRSSGAVVVDTGVFAADVVRHSPLVEAYGPMLVGRHVYVSFQTVAEVRFGAYRGSVLVSGLEGLGGSRCWTSGRVE